MIQIIKKLDFFPLLIIFYFVVEEIIKIII